MDEGRLLRHVDAERYAELREHRDEIARRTGLVLDPYFSAPKMAWLRRNVETAGVVTTSDAWLLHRLTGRFVTDATTASRSLLVQRPFDEGPAPHRALMVDVEGSGVAIFGGRVGSGEQCLESVQEIREREVRLLVRGGDASQDIRPLVHRARAAGQRVLFCACAP